MAPEISLALISPSSSRSIIRWRMVCGMTNLPIQPFPNGFHSSIADFNSPVNKKFLRLPLRTYRLWIRRCKHGFSHPKKSSPPAPAETAEVRQPLEPALSLPSKTDGTQAETALPTPLAGTTAPVVATGKEPCQQGAAQLQAFFAQLDRQEYVADHGLKEKCEKHLIKLIKKLFANPPVVVRETENLFTILTNSAHFYRVLGKNDLLLLRDILTREGEDIETIMARFYHWSELEPGCSILPIALHLPLNSLYQYAGFFLNTLGGQSYLYRRTPRIRTLVKYYSVLVIDRANDKGMNRYGIDLRFPINSTMEEMEDSPNLKKRDAYLDMLQALAAKYRTQPARRIVCPWRTRADQGRNLPPRPVAKKKRGAIAIYDDCPYLLKW